MLQAGQLEKVLFMIAAHTPSITSAKSILFCNTLMAVFLLCAFIFLMKIVSSPSKADCTLRLFLKYKEISIQTTLRFVQYSTALRSFTISFCS